jgi:HK97 family phage major capsid protein
MRHRNKKPSNPEPSTEQKQDLLIRAGLVQVIDTRKSGEPGKEGGSISVRMSVSSEEPVLTYVFFNDQWQRAFEILDHSPAAVDMSRCKEGLVIRDRHYGDQIGLIAKVEFNDRKLGGTVEFCTGARAQEISADAAKGLRRNVSIGYTVDSASYRLDGDKDGIPVVRAMSWCPYEASFEPVPADVTVGVERAAKEPAATAAHPQEKKMDPKIVAAMFRMAMEHGIKADVVQKLIDDGKGLEEVRSLVIEKQGVEITAARKEIETLAARKPDGTVVKALPPIGGSEQEQQKITRQYSLLNVIRSMAGAKVDIGFEREVSQECAKISGKSATGIIIPHAVLAQRDLTKAGTSSATIATNLLAGEYIDLLRTNSILGPLGVKFLSGLVGDIAIPKMTAGATGYWVAEGSDITESAPTMGQVTGSPHTAGALVDISRKMLLQSTPAAEMFVRDEIIQRIARTVQIAVFAGTGADGQPTAITGASGINNPSVTQGTPTYAEILNFPGSIMADSAQADGQKFAMTGEVWAKLAATARGTGDGFVLDPDSQRCIGFPYLISEDIGANSLFFGNWATVVVGIWGNGVDLNVDTATLSASGGIRLVGLQDVDVMVRLGQALAYNAAVTS